jgi:phosphomannomutase
VAERVPTIKFGTDGWRDLIARDFTFANVRACAEGVCRLLAASGASDRGLVIGYDTRFGSRDFAAEVAQVATAHGIRTYLADRVAPTPVISYSVLHFQAAGAVVITASHNPAPWNGFKYKPEYGGSATPEVTAMLEQHIASAQRDGAVGTLPLEGARQRGLLIEFNPLPPYLENVARSINLAAIRDAGLRIAVDSMHGAGADSLAQLLSGGRTTVTGLREGANPNFPGMVQPEPIAQNLDLTAEAVRNQGLDVALATDGDADRLGVLDERGDFITTLQTFALLCLHQLEVRGQRGPIVKSLTQSAMINKLGTLYQVPVHTTAVGFKYLGPVMMRENALAAGEESGGYAFRGNIPERDGIFSGLLFLELMVQTGKRPSKLVEWLYDKVGPHHYDRWDVHLAPEMAPPSRETLLRAPPRVIGGLPVTGIDTTDGVRFLLEGGFWGLVRASGTEPLVRLYAEGESPERVQRLLADLRSLTRL